MKRLIDILGSATALVLLAPVLVLTAMLVKLKMGGPVLFRQTRAGHNAGQFDIIKFRTMRNAIDADGKPLSDAERLTPLGEKLRATSLDELPELWNVLKGEMSLVGPRPLLTDYLSLYSPRQARRHEVLPGITGWAQINGRNALTWEEKFELDVWYVENHNTLLDLKILWLTVVKVLKQDGISADGEATMPRFTGTK